MLPQQLLIPGLIRASVAANGLRVRGVMDGHVVLQTGDPRGRIFALKAFMNGQVGIGLMKGHMAVEVTLARRPEGTHRAVEFEVGGGPRSRCGEGIVWRG